MSDSSLTLTTNYRNTSSSILVRISNLFNCSVFENERQGETQAITDREEFNGEVTLCITESPSGSSTSDTESIDDLRSQLEDLRGTPQSDFSRRNSQSAHNDQSTALYPTSHYTTNRAIDFKTTNDSLGIERSANQSQHDVTLSTNTSGIWPDDPAEYTPSALSSFRPPRGANTSSVSLNTEIANAIELSRSRRTAATEGHHSSANYALQIQNRDHTYSDRTMDRSAVTVITKQQTIVNLTIKTNDQLSTIKVNPEVTGAPPPPPLPVPPPPHPVTSPAVIRRITRSQTQATSTLASTCKLGFTPGQSQLTKPGTSRQRHTMTFTEDTHMHLPYPTTHSEAPSTIHPNSSHNNIVNSVNAYVDETTTTNDATVIPNPNFFVPNTQPDTGVIPVAHSTLMEPPALTAVRNMRENAPPPPRKRSSACSFNPYMEEELYYYDLGN
jgi:hypothetical protein